MTHKSISKTVMPIDNVSYSDWHKYIAGKMNESKKQSKFPDWKQVVKASKEIRG